MDFSVDVTVGRDVDDFVVESDVVVVGAVEVGLVVASVPDVVPVDVVGDEEDGLVLAFTVTVPGGAAVVVVSIDTDTSGSVVVVGAGLLVDVGLFAGTVDDEEEEEVLVTAGPVLVSGAEVPEVEAADEAVVDSEPAVEPGVALVGSLVDSLPSSGASVSVVTESARGLPVDEGALLNGLVELAVVASGVAAGVADWAVVLASIVVVPTVGD